MPKNLPESRQIVRIVRMKSNPSKLKWSLFRDFWRAVVLWLASAGLAAQEPNSPGADVFVARDFIHTAFSQAIDKVSPISVCLDRYRVSGSGRLVGTMSFSPLPAEGQIRLRMTLNGDATACDRTLVRSLQIHTRDRSRVRVTQDVLAAAAGIRTGPPTIEATTSSQLLGIETGRPPILDALLRRLGKARFRRRPEESNRLATNVSRIALTQAAERDAAELLGQANAQLREQVLEPLLRNPDSGPAPFVERNWRQRLDRFSGSPPGPAARFRKCRCSDSSP